MNEDRFSVYKLVAPNGKYYIGVTNNLKRRFKEHRSSRFPIGKSIRKYGYENFTKIILASNLQIIKAYELEASLVSIDTLKDQNCLNLTVGGTCSDMLLSGMNPMKNPDVSSRHPALFSAFKNPMHDKATVQRMIESQKRRAVIIDGQRYAGVREAAKLLGHSRQKLIYRLRSKSFPTHLYLG